MREAYIHRDEQRLETALNEVRAKYTKTRYKKEIENAELALEILKAARSTYVSLYECVCMGSRCYHGQTISSRSLKCTR